MTNNFFRKTAANLAKNGSIQEKYIELYAKAMEAVVAISVNLLTTLLIGYLCGMWWHCIVMLATFIPLRSYAGGYHTRGYVSCYLYSCVLMTAAMLFIKHIWMEGRMLFTVWLLFIISVVIIFLLAPLADENKPISEKEAKLFKRRTRIILGAEIIIALILIGFGSGYAYPIIMTISLCALSLVLHKGRELLKSFSKLNDN